jgi:hypothetical protein
MPTHARLALFTLIFVIISALGVALIGWVTLHLVADNLDKSPDLASRMSAAGRMIVERRAWLAVACLPPLIAAAITLAKRPSAATRWLCFIISELWLLLLLALVLYAFIASLAPLYEYQPLD